MKKQTAVDWLFEKMTEQGTNPYWDMRFIQAKEMERKQITDSYNQGICEGFDYGYHNDNPKEESGEEYYNKTYEKK